MIKVAHKYFQVKQTSWDNMLIHLYVKQVGCFLNCIILPQRLTFTLTILISTIRRYKNGSEMIAGK